MPMLAPWIDAVAWTLLHFIWQGALVGLAWALLRKLLPRQASHLRYAAGLCALALLALAPLITLFVLRPAADLAAGGPVLDGAPGAIDAGAMLAASAERWLPWIVAAWIAGVCVQSLRALRQWYRLDRIVRHCAIAHARVDALLAGLAERFGLRQRMRALVSDRVDTPMLIGWLRPVILLPTAVALAFPRQQLELILAHELGHLARHDHLVNFVQTALETVLFYHPVVHWISREVRNERELCCDRLVLATMQGEPRDYARTLAALEELRLEAPLALAASGGELVERVRRIVGVESPQVLVQARPSARWLLLAGGLLLGWALLQRLDGANMETVLADGPRADWIQVQAPVTPTRLLMALPLTKWRAPRLALAAHEPAPAASVVPAAAVAIAPAVAEPATLADQAPPAPSAARVALPDPAAAAAATPRPAASAPTLAPAAAPAARPVVMHSVAPEFPGNAYAESVIVEASFTIAADGSVHDIRLKGRADNSFKRATERALRQWRFDPASLGSNPALRYSQEFVFAPPGAAESSEGCLRQTGSMICRSGLAELDQPPPSS